MTKLLVNAMTTANNFATKLESKVKGTIVEQWVNFWKNVLRDYKEVVIDLRKDVKSNPRKALLLCAGGCIVSGFISTNPDKISFRSKFLQYTNEMILVHPSCQNSEASDHLKFIERCYNKNVLRHSNLLLFSLIWIDKHSDQCNLYECNCPYTQLTYNRIGNRIVDIGFLGTWWVLSRKMLNYDVNF